jgi:hypothetical protein
LGQRSVKIEDCGTNLKASQNSPMDVSPVEEKEEEEEEREKE